MSARKLPITSMKARNMRKVPAKYMSCWRKALKYKGPVVGRPEHDGHDQGTGNNGR